MARRVLTRSLASIDAATAAKLLQTYLPTVYALGVNFPGIDRAELRAIGEEAILEAHLTFDGRGTAAGWTRRTIQWWLADAAAAVPWEAQTHAESFTDAVNGADPGEHYFRALAVHAMGQLTIRQQMVVDGYMHGETYAEVGSSIGISPQLAHKTATTAFARLRQLLDDEDAG